MEENDQHEEVQLEIDMEESPLPVPEPAPEPNGEPDEATQAFARLEGELAMMRRAVQHLRSKGSGPITISLSGDVDISDAGTEVSQHPGWGSGSTERSRRVTWFGIILTLENMVKTPCRSRRERCS